MGMSAASSIAAGSRRGGLGGRQLVVLWAARLGILAAILIAWQVQGTKDPYWTLVFSTPVDVARRLGMWLGDPRWWTHLLITLEEAFLGYLLGVTAAVALVAVIAPSRFLTRFTAPYIAVLNALPKIALAPLFILWFGTTLQSKVYFVASLICFIVFHGVHTGLKTIDPGLLANTRMLGATRYHLLRDLYIPAIVTWIISSLRLSLAFALLAAVIAEYLGANRGLGFLIANGQRTLATDTVVAGILVVALVSILLDRLLVRAERRMTQWRAF